MPYRIIEYNKIFSDKPHYCPFFASSFNEFHSISDSALPGNLIFNTVMGQLSSDNYSSGLTTIIIRVFPSLTAPFCLLLKKNFWSRGRTGTEGFLLIQSVQL